MQNRTEKEKIESKVHRKVRRARIQDAVVFSIYATTLLGASIMMPNAVRLLKHVSEKIGPTPRLKERVSQAYTRLIKSGILERLPTAQGMGVSLTERGKQMALRLEAMEQLRGAKPKKWDFKWRIIMFDIWERRRGVRDELRRTLEEVGFIKIQNSVWAYPYPCEELLVFLRIDLRLGRSILYLVADEVEHDKLLRKHFNLPLD